MMLKSLIVVLLNISHVSAGSLALSNRANDPIAAGYEIDDGYLLRGKRDLLYWNRASNGFRKYGRHRDISKLEKNDKTANLMSQIRKYYVQKESANPEKVKMIKNIIRTIEKSDKNRDISALVTKNQK